VQFGPDSGTGAEDQKPHAFAAISEREHKQPRTTVLPSLRVTHHRAGAVIDLCFFARRGLDHGACFRRRRSAQLAYKPLDTLVTDSETVAVDQILPDRLGIAIAREPEFNQFPVLLADADQSTPTRLRLGDRYRHRFRARVGNHLIGRFCR